MTPPRDLSGNRASDMSSEKEPVSLSNRQRRLCLVVPFHGEAGPILGQLHAIRLGARLHPGVEFRHWRLQREPIALLLLALRPGVQFLGGPERAFRQRNVALGGDVDGVDGLIDLMNAVSLLPARQRDTSSNWSRCWPDRTAVAIVSLAWVNTWAPFLTWMCVPSIWARMVLAPRQSAPTGCEPPRPPRRTLDPVPRLGPPRPTH